MDIKINLTKVYVMDKLIHLQATGNSKVFAKKLNLSEATFFNYLRILRSLNIPIEYSRENQTYYYNELGRIAFHFCKQES